MQIPCLTVPIQISPSTSVRDAIRSSVKPSAVVKNFNSPFRLIRPKPPPCVPTQSSPLLARSKARTSSLGCPGVAPTDTGLKTQSENLTNPPPRVPTHNDSASSSTTQVTVGTVKPASSPTVIAFPPLKRCSPEKCVPIQID